MFVSLLCRKSLKCGSSKNCVLKACSQGTSVVYEHVLSVTTFAKKEVSNYKHLPGSNKINVENSLARKKIVITQIVFLDYPVIISPQKTELKLDKFLQRSLRITS